MMPPAAVSLFNSIVYDSSIISTLAKLKATYNQVQMKVSVHPAPANWQTPQSLFFSQRSADLS